MIKFIEKTDSYIAETILVKVRISKMNKSIAINGVLSRDELFQIADKLEDIEVVYE